MKYLIALIIIIAIVAFVLQRRGSTGLGGTKNADVDRALGESDVRRDSGGATGGGI